MGQQSAHRFQHVNHFNYFLPPGLDVIESQRAAVNQYALHQERLAYQPGVYILTPPESQTMSPPAKLQLYEYNNENEERPQLPPLRTSITSNRRPLSTLENVPRALEMTNDENSESNSKLFLCNYCDKTYQGKNSRSILRRHVKEKHAIELPRGTRWDNDPNRPKNDEERRQRMLDSKKRQVFKALDIEAWAQKARAKKVAEREQDFSQNTYHPYC
ncbi:hypothetical protein G9A89_016536 [Geosiphon pyriformis]|nr:hypothetical protein G9A89_016536 [Geosiphon pyriformis]